MNDIYNPHKQLTSGRLLAKNVLWNLLGYSAPLLIAIFAIPLLIKGLGVDRFGLLTIAWVIIGYFSLFDLGIGRALTQLLSSKLGSYDGQDVPELIWTSVSLLFFIGVTGAAITALLSPWLVNGLLRVPQNLSRETVNSFYVLAGSVPVVTVTAGFRGVLEARQKFFAVNALRIPMGVYTLLGPLVVLPFSHRLDLIVLSLLIGRIIFMIAHFALCVRTVPDMKLHMSIKPPLMRPLLQFGAWMTVSNIVSPLMTNLDRFFIGIFMSISFVAYYATPHEMVTKLSFIPGAVVGVLFPAFAMTYSHDQERAVALFRRGMNYTFLALFPLTLVMIIFAYEGLNIWLGHDFAFNSQHVMQWLALGIFVNSLAYIPFALIQGAGRPDITGKLQLLELPFYFGAFWLLVRRFGIEGAAIAWTLRVTIEAFFLFHFAKKLLPAVTYVHYRAVVIAGLVLGATMSVLYVINLESQVLLKMCAVTIILGSFSCYSWRYLVREDTNILLRIYSKQ